MSRLRAYRLYNRTQWPHTLFHRVLRVFAGYFGQVLRQSRQLKEVQALVRLVALHSGGSRLLSITHDQVLLNLTRYLQES